MQVETESKDGITLFAPALHCGAKGGRVESIHSIPLLLHYYTIVLYYISTPIPQHCHMHNMLTCIVLHIHCSPVPSGPEDPAGETQ